MVRIRKVIMLGRKPTAGTNRMRKWIKKGYDIDGPVNQTRNQALGRAAYLRSVGYKARVVKGNYTLYTVAREPYDPKKHRKGTLKKRKR